MLQPSKHPILVLLPGLDGTGELFAGFVAAIRGRIETKTVRYPTDAALSYEELAAVVQSALPISDPFVIVAESFSAPIAVLCAASKPPNLKGLVISAGFISSPVPAWLRPAVHFLAPFFFTRLVPKTILKFMLLGSGASPVLVDAVRAAIDSVSPRVLSARVRSILQIDVRRALAEIAVPIQYLQAARDRLVSRAAAAEISHIHPQLKLVSIAGPHLLLQREPDLTSEAVATFVRSLA